MARLFVPLDVEFATDPKILAAGPLAAYLYVVGLAHAKRNPATDGFIHRSQLAVLGVGFPNKVKAHADTLVAVGLWTCTENGWQIVAWTKHNHTKAQLDASAEIAAESGAFGAHQRHHVKENKPSPKCKWCIDEHLDRKANGVPHGGAHWGQLAKEEVEVEEQVEKEEEVEEPSSSSVLTPPGDDHAEDDEFIKQLATAIAEHRADGKLRDPGARRRFVDTTVANLLRTEMGTLRAFVADKAHMRTAPLVLAAQVYDAVRNAS